MRNAEPVRVWQSVQWHTDTLPGSTSASYVIAPQWQPPVIFMRIASIQFDVVASHHLAPAVHLARDEFLQRLGAADLQVHAQGLGEMLAQVGLAEHLHQLGVEFVEDLLASSGRREDAPPGKCREAREALLRES